MRRLIISDIHGNIDALFAVLQDAHGLYDEIICCGDLVGYGASPGEVVDWVRDNAAACVRGNHDRVCCGLEDLEWFNPSARAAALWSQSALSESQRQWLAALPRGPLYFNDFEISHGAPFDEDEYLVHTQDVVGADRYLMRPICFVGHTHLQRGWVYHRGGLQTLSIPAAGEHDSIVELDPDALYIINPGSVGQPRDRNPHAAYALWDNRTNLLAYCRVPYDIASAQQRILATGLDPWLAERLAHGA